ncbi:threonine synthase [Gallaecimonas pentaromativorans]|uniref:Threonine synthase n=1 Tax=Gallaecimonas pentaromativorans TaxID=584787 RepID=A0A3N1PFX0_9GAMM|nr:threonine synthase [Gallaecimonas pentaromativorans]ROQ27493.1 L-threonine synthase [Gallaecimonas pentaromativorans]
MQFYNLKHPEQRVSFSQAVRQGLGKDQGLFFPESLPMLDASELAELPRHQRYQKILSGFLKDTFSEPTLSEMIAKAFPFEAPLVPVGPHFALELFHGPTLAFKDFGARFMAQCLARLSDGKPITILTATSGDTGAAVAHAFHGLKGVRVVVLYPEGKISRPQEQLFCTLGGNIETLAVEGSFDDCQALVKAAFDDEELKNAIGLNSANSINISRLLAQILYFWDLALTEPNLVVSVPSGNFGDLTAGLMAKAMGAPIKRFIAATNSNDTVPRYLANGQWQPHATVATLSNAMDVSRPNNWPRVEHLLTSHGWSLTGEAVSEADTKASMQTLQILDYLGEPHCAVAFKALLNNLEDKERGAFLCTAHPAKFAESVSTILGIPVPLPKALQDAMEKPNLSKKLGNDWQQLRHYLLQA